MFELSVFADPVELHWSGTRIPLRPKERLLLCRLAFAKGSSVPARQLVADLRDAGPRDAAADTLRSHVSHLRGGIARVAGELGTGLLTTERDAQGAVYRLNLDPVFILLSLGFWGALLGIAGALLSTPLTVVVMAVAAEFEGARWLAVLLSKDGDVTARLES